ncbi:T9SS type B sorting domain-containing protein [Flavobacterium tegetincola]|uniref:DUF7948 domain-containing protein n=1 Tax=Flavobacterium tegetincola TaxID=150172 RepID=UPI0004271184|nr:T9SS type B sorting domain-containing protein [Flavobacterium tegetincola]
MSRLLPLLFILFSVGLFSQNRTTSTGFIENKGQVIDQKGNPNPAVKYLLTTNGLNVQLRKNGFSYDVYEMENNAIINSDKNLTDLENPNKDNDIKTKIKFHRIDINFLNANKNAILIAEDKSLDFDNFYNAVHTPSGLINVYKFQKITYQNIYKNVDVVFFIPKDSTKVVEYNFIVKPGGKVSDIRLKFKGAETDLFENKIKMNLRFGQMYETLPLSWIEDSIKKQEIQVRYKRLKDNVYGFEGDFESSDKTIVIDPVPIRLWGTFYGGVDSSYNVFKGDLEADASGNLFLVGSTNSSSLTFASSGAHQGISNSNSLTGYIAKFTSSGNRVWGTYYGGNSSDMIHGVKVDSQNNIIVTGETNSATNISTSGTYKEYLSGFKDAFVSKFNTNGVLIWGTYFGGEADDYSFDIDVDNLNNIYIVGSTRSYTNISVNNNFQVLLNGVGTISNSSFDGLIAKFDSNGQIIWSTYCGGDSSDELKTIKVVNNFLVTAGHTINSSNIATSGAHQTSIGSFIDGIIYKFSLNGIRDWSSYYGGQGIDKIRAIEIDSNDDIYFGGDTNSTNNIATSDSFDAINQNQETGFLVKFNSLGQRLWGTFLGSGVKLYSIKQRLNEIYIGATGSSGMFSNVSITNNCSYDPSGFAEGYIGKFSSAGNFIWGSFVGGFDQSSESKICINGSKISIAGSTSSVNNTSITDSNSYQQTFTSSSAYYLMTFEDLNDCNIVAQPTVSSSVCIGEEILFSAPPGFNYNWTGPNGYSSNLQNTSISNALPLNTGIYNLLLTNDCNCFKNYTFNVAVGDIESPIPTISDLPALIGNCNTVIATIPTALDNCAGTVIGTTNDPLSYSLGGVYSINWNFNDGNGNSSMQTQTVTITETPIPISNEIFYYCLDQNPTLNDVAIIGQNIIYYDAIANGNTLTNTTPLQNGITYYVSQTVDGCESLRIPVTATIYETPAPTGDAIQTFCESQVLTLADFVVSGTDLLFYDASSIGNVLPLTTPLTNGLTYYTSQIVNGCESSSRLALVATIISGVPATDFSAMLCDNLNDGFEVVNLSSYNSALIANDAAYTFEYYTNFSAAENQTLTNKITAFSNYALPTGLNAIYVRVMFANSCYEVVTLVLEVIPSPRLGMEDTYAVCENGFVTVTADAGFDGYLWSTGETTQAITVTQAGNFSVTVTKFTGTLACSSTKNISVAVSESATITSVETSDWTSNDNVITVFVSGSGVYEYSVDGQNYQASNQFYGLPNGLYTVYVNDTLGCGVAEQDVYLLMYPKFFTPNGDSYNDFWGINFYQKELNLVVKIFDRYGKFIKQLTAKDPFWDGTFNGNNLPATDYWFTVIRQDGQEYKGHFTLKR